MKSKIAVIIALTLALLIIASAQAQEPEYLTYLPHIARLPVYDRGPLAEVHTDNLEAMGEILIDVYAPGCSSVDPVFVGIDRDIFPPSVYHQWCIAPEIYGGQTTGAQVLIYVYSPMVWDAFAVEVHYPGGMLETILVKGPWSYRVEPK